MTDPDRRIFDRRISPAISEHAIQEYARLRESNKELRDRLKNEIGAHQFCKEHNAAQTQEETASSLGTPAPAAAPTSVLYTTRQYPCGCVAEGCGDIPAYCDTHGSAAIDKATQP